MRMRCSRVSSRKRWMRARRAAAIGRVVGAFGYSGSASVPTTRISSRSAVTAGGPVNQSSGSRPANQPSSVCGVRRLFRHYFITSLQISRLQPEPAGPDATMPPTGGTVGASSSIWDFGGWEGNPCPTSDYGGRASRQRDATMPPCGGGGIVKRCPIPGGDSGAHLVAAWNVVKRWAREQAAVKAR